LARVHFCLNSNRVEPPGDLQLFLGPPGRILQTNGIMDPRASDSPYVRIGAVGVTQGIRRSEGAYVGVVPAVAGVVPAEVGVELEALPEGRGRGRGEVEVVAAAGAGVESGLAERQVLEELR